MWGIPVGGHGSGGAVPEALRDNPLFQTMADCQIVLRFFAFRDTSRIKGSVRRMLDNCMERNEKLPSEQLSVLRRDFKSRLQVVRKIFGDKAFEIKVGMNTRFSRPLFDALMIAIDRLWDDRQTLITNKQALVRHLQVVLARKRAYGILIGRPNTADAVRKRISLLEKELRAAAKL